MTDIVYNKNGVPFDIDAIATDINGKMDKDGLNATCPIVVSRTPNNQGGIVEIWSDGYCVQTGITGAVDGAEVTLNVTLDQAYKDISYSCYVTIRRNATTYRDQFLTACNITTNSFTVYSNWAGSANANTSNYAQWRTEGYIR